MYIQLPAYSVAQNISLTTEEVSIGYSRSWHRYSKAGKWKVGNGFALFITLAILFTSKIFVMSLVIIYYNNIREYMRWKASAFYYLFWGCHCFTLFVLMPVQIIFLSTSQSNLMILIVSLISSRLLDITLALAILCVYTKRGIELLPVPLSSLISYTKYFWILNLVAMFSFFVFISELLQMIPNILIAYYAYPSKTLTHLAFFQVLFVCLVVAFGGILLLLEKCAWLRYIYKTKRIPEELVSSYLIDALINIDDNKIQSETSTGAQGQLTPTENGISGSQASVGKAQGQHQNGTTLTDSTKHDDFDSVRSKVPSASYPYSLIEVTCNRNATLRHSGWDTIIIMFFQILAALIGLSALGAILLIVGMIIFLDPTTRDDLQGILTILPTIAVDAIIYLIRKSLFGDDRAKKSELTKAVDSHDQAGNHVTGSANHTAATEKTPLLGVSDKR